jgi:acetylornithine deacetylase
MGEIKAFSSSQLDFRITVTGQGPDTTEPIQTAFAHRAVNAVEKARLVLDALDRLGKARAARIHHPRLDAAIGQSTNIMIARIQAGAPGVFSRVPERCVIEGAIAFPPGTPLAEVMAETEATLASLPAEDPWFAKHPPGIEWVSGIPGAEISDDHPLYRTVAAAITAETGMVPIVNAMHTTSDIRNPIVQAGIPCVGLGPLGGDLTQNGATDEWVDIDDYQRAVLIGAQAIIAWCGLAA